MELEQENYHDIDRINARKDNVLRLWNYLLELLRARRSRLELSLLLQHNFQVKTTVRKNATSTSLELPAEAAACAALAPGAQPPPPA